MNLSSLFSKQKQRTVIIADDVGTIRMIVASVFRKVGFEIIEARNGEEVLVMVKAHPPDLIVLDLHMGIKDGITTINDLHQNERSRDIPIIVLSGDSSETMINKVLHMPGVVDYIIKDNLENVTSKLELHLQDIK